MNLGDEVMVKTGSMAGSLGVIEDSSETFRGCFKVYIYGSGKAFYFHPSALERA